MEDNKAQKEHIYRNPKQHSEFILVVKIMTVHFFVWPLALQLWSVSERMSEWVSGVRQTKFLVLAYPAAYQMLPIPNVKWTNIEKWFSLHRMSLGWLRHTLQLSGSLIKWNSTTVLFDAASYICIGEKSVFLLTTEPEKGCMHVCT